MMTDRHFTLYAYPFRSRSERVLWTLKEFNYSFDVVRLDPFKGETNTPEFVNLNPAKKMPVLVENEKVFTESLAIMEYLNDISEVTKLIPTEPDAAYDYRMKIHYGLTEIEPYLWIAEQSTRLKGLYDWPDGTYDSALSLLKSHLPVVFSWLKNNSYIAGDDFTLADIYFYTLLTWAQQNNFDVPEHVKTYITNLEKRSAFPKEALPDK